MKTCGLKIIKTMLCLHFLDSAACRLLLLVSIFIIDIYIFDLYWVCFAAQKMKIEFENLEKTTFLILSYPILSHQNESIFYLVGLTKTIVRVSKSFQN